MFTDVQCFYGLCLTSLSWLSSGIHCARTNSPCDPSCCRPQTSRALLVTATDSADFGQLFTDTKTIFSHGSTPIYVCFIQIAAAYFAYIFGTITTDHSAHRLDNTSNALVHETVVSNCSSCIVCVCFIYFTSEACLRFSITDHYSDFFIVCVRSYLCLQL